MEGKIKVQRTNITKFLTYCESVMQVDTPTKGYFEAKRLIIEKLWSKIDSANDRINENVTTEDEITNGPDFNVIIQSIQKEYERAFIMFDKITVQICSAIEQLEKPQIKLQPLQLPENLVIHTNNSSNIKLKEIEIQQFSGDYNKWISFKNLFDSLIHNNAEFTGLQKMHYLKSCVTGDAERLISQFNITEELYRPAYDALTERFQNEVILVDTHITNILSQPNLTSETGESIKELMDVITENLRALKSLDVDTSTWDPLLLLLLVQKLDCDTRYLWEQKLKPKTPPTIGQFLEFLNARFHALVGSRKFNFSIQTLSTQTPHHTYDQHTRNSSQQLCPICKGNHSIFSCERFRNANQYTRGEMVNGTGLCRKCLRKHTSECTQHEGCRVCNGNHHTFLHNN